MRPKHTPPKPGFKEWLDNTHPDPKKNARPKRPKPKAQERRDLKDDAAYRFALNNLLSLLNQERPRLTYAEVIGHHWQWILKQIHDLERI